MTNIKALFHYDSDTDCINLTTKDTGELIVSLSAVQLVLAVDKLRGRHTRPDETVGIIAMLPDAKRPPQADTEHVTGQMAHEPLSTAFQEALNQVWGTDREATDPFPTFNRDRAAIAADLYARTYASASSTTGSARQAEAAATRAIRYVLGGPS